MWIQQSRASRRIMDGLVGAIRLKRHFSIFILLYTLVFITAGLFIAKSGLIGRVLKPAILDGPRIAYNYVTAQATQPRRITIDIKHKHFQRLAYNRDIAVQRMHLFPDIRDEVPADVRYAGKETPAKIRLKGGGRDHFLHKNKWSFRIDMQGDNTLFGMKRFSIQQPRTRNYVYEWLFHEAATREDILAPRYEFIDVTLNGKDLGIYALEEHFDKRLVEHRARRDGPIIKFDETGWQMERMNFDYANWRELPESGNYYSLPIDMFMTGAVLGDSLLFSQFRAASNLLESFRLGRLEPSQVFDTERLAKYFALCDLFGTHHPLHTNQFRFYYNPITARLEPICFDTNSGHPTKRMSFSFTEEDDTVFEGGGKAFVIPRLFADHTFFETYVKALEAFSQKSYLDELLDAVDDGLRHNIRLIHRESPGYRFTPLVLYQNQQYMRTFLNPSKGLHAYYSGNEGRGIAMEVGNVQEIPIELLSVTYRDSVGLTMDSSSILPGKIRSRPVDYYRLALGLPRNLSWNETLIPELRVNYRLSGSSRIRSESVFPWPHLDNALFSNDLMREPSNIHEAALLSIDENTKQIFVKTGEWNLTRDLIIPAGYKVIAGPGVVVNLFRQAKILSYSPVDFRGSEDNPITFNSPDSTGQGLAVIRAREGSVLEHVRFNNLSNPAMGAWVLTGAVTFYESPVRIRTTHFAGNRAEDALNIIRSAFSIDDALFTKTTSDAFDADFCTGTVTNTSFVDCGNDAIDVSGSVVTCDHIFVNGAGDKGLSVGENSQMTASALEMKSVSVGVASKDMSQVTVDDIRISDSGIGLTAYMKKSEFGPATITATGLELHRVRSPYLPEPDSRITVDGKAIRPTSEDLKTLIYGTP